MNKVDLPEQRPGFTLVELLVVVAIIGVLVALTIPAVNSVREGARRTACTNKLRQLVLAADNHHAAKGVYPPGRFLGKFGSGQDSRAWSWLAMSLPYMEEQGLYEAGNIPDARLNESSATAAHLELFVCPSANGDLSTPKEDAGNLIGFAVGQTTYKGVSGANWGADKSLNLESVSTKFRNKGTNNSYDGLREGDGILWRADFKHRMGHRRVVDGTSKTFLAGEDLPQHNIWASWPYANNAYGTCAIPPNLIPDDPTWQYDSYSFRSEHPGGLNFGMADGSVHFVSESIELDIYRALATRNGGEPFGLADL